jgi:trehalose synthase
MRLVDTSDLWWKNAVVYCVDVDRYLDENGDGIGDLSGLAQRMGYLDELGVSCLWLMPFYPTPGRDNGYDVSDFYGVDPAVGTHGDLVELVRAARDRGIRVVVDLVVNHTSDQHPWFLSARSSRDSPYRDYYVWRDEIPENPRESMFPGVEDGVWEWDEKTEQYYLHSFYHHQPDLNVENEKVQEELEKVMGFWLELGIDGFRVDAVPSFVSSPERPDPQRDHDVLSSLRAFAQRRSPGAILLGEVNVPHEEQAAYFGADDQRELHMQFDFESNQALFLALARQDPAPLAAALQTRPSIDVVSQFANFVRNHDELTLDQLSESERDEVFEVFAPDESQRVFGRGVRRRLPPMLGGDPRRVRMVYSLLFSLPGTPVLFYGEEIGMGENLDIPERSSVRTPMQWTATGGFSLAPDEDHILPMPDGPFSPRHVNAEAQWADPESLLRFVGRLARTYRRSPEIGWGELEMISTDQPKVLAHTVTAPFGQMLALHNFSEDAVTVTVDLGEDADERWLVGLEEGSIRRLDGNSLVIDLPAYGAYRARVCRPGDDRMR